MVQITDVKLVIHDEAIAIIKRAALNGMKSAGEHLRAESIAEVPIDTHALQHSCEVSDDGDATVYVSYNTPYAVIQHENMGFNHPNGGKAKYLEDPLNRERQNMIGIVGKGIGDALK